MTALLRVTLPLFAMGMLLMALGSRAQSREVRRARILKLAVFCVIVHTVLACILLVPLGAVALALAIVLLGGRELRGALRAVPSTMQAFISMVAGLLAAAFLLQAWQLAPNAVAFCFLVCAIFDGFCQVIGQWLGRRPLMPRISPAKTVEGLIGGVLASIAMAGVLRDLVGLDLAASFAAGGVMAVGAFCGDASGSWIKRRAGLKDFSSVLPGHGGIVDRFSSFVFGLVFAAPLLPLQFSN